MIIGGRANREDVKLWRRVWMECVNDEKGWTMGLRGVLCNIQESECKADGWIYVHIWIRS